MQDCSRSCCFVQDGKLKPNSLQTHSKRVIRRLVWKLMLWSIIRRRVNYVITSWQYYDDALE